MGNAAIGIKNARGDFFPVIDPAFRGKKRVVLAPVHSDQSNAKIDLFLLEEGGTEPRYLGTLFMERIVRTAGGAPEIELVIGTDSEGNVHATAKDKGSGETRSVSVSLEDASIREDYLLEDDVGGVGDPIEYPDLDDEPSMPLPAFGGRETVSAEQAVRKPVNPMLLLGFVVLGLLVILVVAWFILRGTQGEAVPPLEAAVPLLGVIALRRYAPRGGTTGARRR